MAIAIGDKLPAAVFKKFGADGMVDVTGDELFAGRKVVLFAVPGAFTPTCHEQHLPGFVQHADALKAKGVDDVVCVAVNDPFVMRAWEQQTGAGDTITMLSDGNADFTRATGMDVALTGPFLGTRSKRYAMVVEDGVVKELLVEDNPGAVAVSGAEAILAKL
ncbi:MAG: peroxiredoxin [Alphaproteobacteria bacterium]